jgi:phosphatidylglycerophosphate synthase
MYYISDVIDGVDGIIARRKNQVTPYGAYLDSCLDRYVDVTVLLGICIHLSEFKYVWIIGIFAILGSFMRSYTTHRAEALNKIALTVPGISWHRRRRMHIIIAGALLSIYFPAALFYVLVIIAVIGNTYALCRIMPWMLKDFDTVDEQGKKHLPKTSIRKFQEQR